MQDGVSNPPLCTEYLGQFVHEGTMGGTSSLKYIITSEGRIINSGTDAAPVWSWEYNLTDHLGNVRAVLAPTANAGYASVVQQTSYFPFGMVMSEISSFTSKNKYLYNGKEQQTDFGLNWYDYGARFYDPTIGHWPSPDPKAEKYYSISPYVYCADNPIKYIDPNGKEIVIAGSSGFQKTTFDNMQKLSSSNLAMLKSGQIVEASSYKGAKSNIAFSGTGTGKKDFGTSLIHDLSSNQKHTVTVKQGSEANNTNDFLPTNGNYSNAQNPKIGSGGTLRFDPESTGSGIVNKDGSTGVDASIILGHELIHSDKAMNGKTLNMKENIYDPASPSNWSQYISKEEVDTRSKENILRKESNSANERLIP